MDCNVPSAWDGNWFLVSERRFIYKVLNICPFGQHNCIGPWKVRSLNHKTTSGMGNVVTPTNWSIACNRTFWWRFRVILSHWLLSVSDFHLKNLQITSKLLTQGYRYHKLRQTFGKLFSSYSALLSKFYEILFLEYVSEGISPPVFYGDLVYKLSRVKCGANFVTSGSKTVKRLRRRKYDQVIIERTICLVLGPSTALYRSFRKDCIRTNKAVGNVWRVLSKPPQRRQGPDPSPLWLLVGTPLVLGQRSLPDWRSIAYSGGCFYIFLINCFYHFIFMFV